MTQGKTFGVSQQVAEGQMIPTEERNVEELRVTRDEGFGETEMNVAAAAEDGAPRETEEESGSEEGIGGDGPEYKRKDEHESSQVVPGDEEASHEIRSTPSSLEKRQKYLAPEDLSEGLHEGEPSLNAVDYEVQEMPEVVLQQVEESQIITTEDQNAGKLRGSMGAGFGETGANLAAAADEGALRGKEDEIRSIQGIVTVGGDGVSADAEGVTETPPNTSGTGPLVKLSSAERNWDDWAYVVSGDQTSGQEQLPPLPDEIDDEGPPVSEDGLTSSHADNPEDDTAYTNASMSESRGTSDQEAGVGVSSPTLEVPGTKSVIPCHEQGASLFDCIPLFPQSEAIQSSKEALSELSSALRNWEDWDNVVKAESERLSRSERLSLILEPDLGDGEHETGREYPNRVDSDIVEGGNNEQEVSVKTPPAARTSDIAMISGQETDGLSPGKQSGTTVTSVPDEGGSLFRFPKAELGSKVSNNTSPTDSDDLDSGHGPSLGFKEPVEAGRSNVKEDDWKTGKKSGYQSAGSRHSSPSSEEADHGELSSERGFSSGLPTAVNVSLAKRNCSNWEDLRNGQYVVFDGPDGEALVFKRTAVARDKLSAKALGGRKQTPPTLEESDDDEGGSSSLRRRRRQAPSSDNRSLSVGTWKAASSKGVVKSADTASSSSFQDHKRSPKSLPASSRRKSESGDSAPLVTRRPLIYRGSRRDYASEVEDDVFTNEPFGMNLHLHTRAQHEDAMKYAVEKVLLGQTKYELTCPICGALITRKIVVRKKEPRVVNEGDPRWTSEITPVEDDGNQSPRSDVSSEDEDQSGGWKQGVRPFLGHFFGS